MSEKYKPSKEEIEKAEEMAVEGEMTPEQEKMSKERERYIRERDKNRDTTANKFGPYLESRNKNLSDLTDIVKNRLLDALTRDATEIGYGWHKVRGLDIKDGVASYIKYFDMGGSYDIYDKDIYLKIVSEDDIIEKKLAESSRSRKEFEKYDKFTTVDIIDVDKERNIITVRLSGGGEQEITLEISYGVKKDEGRE